MRYIRVRVAKTIVHKPVFTRPRPKADFTPSTATISIPQEEGWNVVISMLLHEVREAARAVAGTQSAGFRHRKDLLWVRLTQRCVFITLFAA